MAAKIGLDNSSVKIGIKQKISPDKPRGSLGQMVQQVRNKVKDCPSCEEKWKKRYSKGE